MSPDALSALDDAIEQCSPEERAALVVSLAARLARLGACLTQVPDSASPKPDRNISIEEAAERLGVSRRYVYAHAGDLPFSRRVGRRLLFSERGLERWLRQQSRR